MIKKTISSLVYSLRPAHSFLVTPDFQFHFIDKSISISDLATNSIGFLYMENSSCIVMIQTPGELIKLKPFPSLIDGIENFRLSYNASIKLSIDNPADELKKELRQHKWSDYYSSDHDLLTQARDHYHLLLYLFSLTEIKIACTIWLENSGSNLLPIPMKKQGA